MDNIRQFSCEMAMRSTCTGVGFTPQNRTDECILSARKWDAYLREAVPGDAEQFDAPGVEESPMELTEAQILAAMMGDEEAIAVLHAAQSGMAGIVERAHASYGIAEEPPRGDE